MRVRTGDSLDQAPARAAHLRSRGWRSVTRAASLPPGTSIRAPAEPVTATAEQPIMGVYHGPLGCQQTPGRGPIRRRMSSGRCPPGHEQA